MALRFNSTKDGKSFEWKVERGGRLSTRAAGKQRWSQYVDGISNLGKAKHFVETEGHEVTK